VLLSFRTTQAGTLQSVVTDISVSPVTSANIILLGLDKGASIDLNGYYEIFSLNPGEFTILIAKLKLNND